MTDGEAIPPGWEKNCVVVIAQRWGQLAEYNTRPRWSWGRVIIFWWKSEYIGYNYFIHQSVTIGQPNNLLHSSLIYLTDNQPIAMAMGYKLYYITLHYCIVLLYIVFHGILQLVLYTCTQSLAIFTCIGKLAPCQDTCMGRHSSTIHYSIILQQQSTETDVYTFTVSHPQ